MFVMFLGFINYVGSFFIAELASASETNALVEKER